AKNYDERTTTELVEAGAYVYTPPMETTEEVRRLYRFVKAQAAKLGQGELGAMIVGGSADANYICAAGVPTICSMGPAGVGPHSNNEYVFVSSFVERAQLTAMSIMHLDELENF
ncbi:MAG: M20/M25/M40 family metallo-hydrolase, partial [Phascolarctobacterium sp.]|nr:M20/M25/M40 family metallo-hydrolase [Phascolarctobacterium sp.]